MTNEWSNLDERYFEWLYNIVEPLGTRDPSRSHAQLCEAMHRLPFEWFIDRDENRAEYGRDLRDEFMDEHGLSSSDVDRTWLDLECSIFEMLIALADAASFQTDMTTEEWFWQMVRNIKLERYTDDLYSESVHSSVVAILRRVIRRKYQPCGRGGFFPLRNPKGDQREVELWYQLSAYLIENFDF